MKEIAQKGSQDISLKSPPTKRESGAPNDWTSEHVARPEGPERAARDWTWQPKPAGHEGPAWLPCGGQVAIGTLPRASGLVMIAIYASREHEGHFWVIVIGGESEVGGMLKPWNHPVRADAVEHYVRRFATTVPQYWGYFPAEPDILACMWRVMAGAEDQ